MSVLYRRSTAPLSHPLNPYQPTLYRSSHISINFSPKHHIYPCLFTANTLLALRWDHPIRSHPGFLTPSLWTTAQHQQIPMTLCLLIGEPRICGQVQTLKPPAAPFQGLGMRNVDPLRLETIKSICTIGLMSPSITTTDRDMKTKPHIPNTEALARRRKRNRLLDVRNAPAFQQRIRMRVQFKWGVWGFYRVGWPSGSWILANTA